MEKELEVYEDKMEARANALVKASISITKSGGHRAAIEITELKKSRTLNNSNFSTAVQDKFGDQLD